MARLGRSFPNIQRRQLAPLASQFSNPNSYSNTTTVSGSNTLSTTITNLPQAGQLLVAWAYVNKGVNSDPVIVIADSAGGTWTQIGSELALGHSSTTWIAAFYKIAAGTETYASITFSNLAAVTAVLEVDEFRGFSHTPTFDLNGQVNSGSAGSLAASTGSDPHVIPELAVAMLGTGGAVTSITTGTATAFSTNTTFPFNITNPTGAPTSQQWVNAGWVGATGDQAAAGASWAFEWSPTRVPGIIGATFYDNVSGTSGSAQAVPAVVEAIPGRASVAVPVAVSATPSVAEAVPAKATTTLAPAFTNPHTYSASVASGTSLSVSITTPPKTGQLLYAAARIATGASVDANITTPVDNTGGSWNLWSNDVGSGSSDGVWTNVWYKVASGNETSVSISWTGSATGTGGAYLEVDEFNGFTGVPTLDIYGSVGLTNVTNFSAQPAASPLFIPELTVSTLDTNDAMGAITTAQFQYANVYPFTLTYPSPTYCAVGWTGEYDIPHTASTNTQWMWRWANLRNVGTFQTSFYSAAASVSVQGARTPVEAVPSKVSVVVPVALHAIPAIAEAIPGKASVSVSGGSPSVTAVGTRIEAIPGTPSTTVPAGLTGPRTVVEVIPSKATPGIGVNVAPTASRVEAVPGSASIGNSGGATAKAAIVEAVSSKASIGIGVNIAATASRVEAIPGTPKIGNSGGVTATSSRVEAIPGTASFGESAGISAKPSLTEVIPAKATVNISAGVLAIPKIVEAIPGTPKAGPSAGLTAKPGLVESVKGIATVGVGITVSAKASVVEAIPGKPTQASPVNLHPTSAPVEAIPGTLQATVGKRVLATPAITEALPGKGSVTLTGYPAWGCIADSDNAIAAVTTTGVPNEVDTGASAIAQVTTTVTPEAVATSATPNVVVTTITAIAQVTPTITAC